MVGSLENTRVLGRGLSVDKSDLTVGSDVVGSLHSVPLKDNMTLLGSDVPPSPRSLRLLFRFGLFENVFGFLSMVLCILNLAFSV